MSNPKYIVHDYVAIIFPPSMDHAETARSLNFKKEEITGAGFVSFGGDGGAICYGESVSLGIKCDAENDNAAIEKLLRPALY